MGMGGSPLRSSFSSRSRGKSCIPNGYSWQMDARDGSGSLRSSADVGSACLVCAGVLHRLDRLAMASWWVLTSRWLHVAGPHLATSALVNGSVARLLPAPFLGTWPSDEPLSIPSL